MIFDIQKHLSPTTHHLIEGANGAGNLDDQLMTTEHKITELEEALFCLESHQNQLSQEIELRRNPNHERGASLTKEREENELEATHTLGRTLER